MSVDQVVAIGSLVGGVAAWAAVVVSVWRAKARPLSSPSERDMNDATAAERVVSGMTKYIETLESRIDRLEEEVTTLRTHLEEVNRHWRDAELEVSRLERRERDLLHQLSRAEGKS